MGSDKSEPRSVTRVEIGQCIYCRSLPSADDPLQDEHIFPFGLFGRQTLVRASCRRCADKTSPFESKVQKQDLYGLRIALGFPTRRKRQRESVSTLPMEIVTNTGETKDIEVPIEDYCPLLPFPLFNPPAYLSKAPYKEGIQMTGWAAAPAKRPLEEIANKYDAKEIAVWTLRYPQAWALMFAKIGYALAVGHYGLARIRAEDAYVTNAILGKTNDVGMWVGCDGEKVYVVASCLLLSLSFLLLAFWWPKRPMRAGNPITDTTLSDEPITSSVQDSVRQTEVCLGSS
jgi:hypothetical protein